MSDAALFAALDLKYTNMSTCRRNSSLKLPAQEFHPAHCALQRFDREAACAVLDRKAVFMVGDSLTCIGQPDERHLLRFRLGGRQTTVVLRKLICEVCLDTKDHMAPRITRM